MNGLHYDPYNSHERSFRLKNGLVKVNSPMLILHGHLATKYDQHGEIYSLESDYIYSKSCCKAHHHLDSPRSEFNDNERNLLIQQLDWVVLARVPGLTYALL